MGVRNPQEQYGGKVQEQIDLMNKALNYPGRFGTPQPGPGTTYQDSERQREVDIASGK